MTTIKIRWTVDELVNVMSLFDTHRVWRTASLTTPSWVEVTTVLTRVPLVASVTTYLFDDITGDPSYYYAISYYNTSSGLDSSLSDPMQGESIGYITIADIRLEGFTETMVDDVSVQRGINRATALIDKATGRWFEARGRTFQLDGKKSQDLMLNIPIIALTSMSLVDQYGETEAIDLSDILVYNRHLTEGLLNPDDRDDPHISWRNVTRRAGDAGGGFLVGKRNIQVVGYFGYTELSPLLSPGETTAGSQVPLDYGETPELIKLASVLLSVRQMYPRVSGDGEEISLRKRIIEERTRDQMYKLSESTNNSDNAFGTTGDVEVDTLISGYMSPMGIGVV